MVYMGLSAAQTTRSHAPKKDSINSWHNRIRAFLETGVTRQESATSAEHSEWQLKLSYLQATQDQSPHSEENNLTLNTQQV